MKNVVRTPSYAYLKLFDNCNARCNMCSCWQTRSPRRTRENYGLILERLVRSGVSEVRFTGGEPLLYRHLPSLIEQVTRSGAHASVITNGWLLPTRVAELARADCREIVISIDGQHVVHDSIRGSKGLLDRCLRGVTLAKEYGINIGVNTVLQASNIDQLGELSGELLTSTRRPMWWHLIPLRDRPSQYPAQTQIAAFAKGFTKLQEVCEKAGTQLIAERTMFEKTDRTPCSVPEGIAYINAESGDVYGCNMLSYGDEAIGNLLHTPLADLYGSAAADQLIEQCAAGTHAECARCDPSSRAMNLLLIGRSRFAADEQRR